LGGKRNSGNIIPYDHTTEKGEGARKGDSTIDLWSGINFLKEQSSVHMKDKSLSEGGRENTIRSTQRPSARPKVASKKRMGVGYLRDKPPSPIFPHAPNDRKKTTRKK